MHVSMRYRVLACSLPPLFAGSEAAVIIPAPATIAPAAAATATAVGYYYC